MFVELLPSMIGLAITPAAIVGAILLLGTVRPFANAVSFMAGFLVVYSIIAAVVVGLASASTEPLLSARTKSVVELVIGLGLLATAAVLLLRRGDHQPARAAKKGLLARLDGAMPPFAFGAGLALAVVNPNVPILLAGLAVVAAADTGHVLGAVALVVASVLGILTPILWRWLAARNATRHLNELKHWIGRHERTIDIAVLLVFGATFTLKGWAGV